MIPLDSVAGDQAKVSLIHDAKSPSYRVPNPVEQLFHLIILRSAYITIFSQLTLPLYFYVNCSRALRKCSRKVCLSLSIDRQKFPLNDGKDPWWRSRKYGAYKRSIMLPPETYFSLFTFLQRLPSPDRSCRAP